MVGISNSYRVNSFLFLGISLVIKLVALLVSFYFETSGYSILSRKDTLLKDDIGNVFKISKIFVNILRRGNTKLQNGIVYSLTSVSRRSEMHQARCLILCHDGELAHA